MEPRYILSATAALMLAVPAVATAQHSTTTTLAQAASAVGLSEIDDDDDRIVPGLGMTVDDLDDADVHAADGDEIGEVEEVLADDSGRIVAVAVEFDDIVEGDEERVVGLERLQADGDDLVTDLTEAEIRALPVWDD